MITKTIVCITMVAVVIVVYLAVYSPHGKVIEGLTQPCPNKWFRDQGTNKCVQTCPLDTQTRNAAGQCKCGLGTPNESCIPGYNCINNVCVGPKAPITTDISIVISNPHAAKPYLQMGKEQDDKNTDLIHSSKKNANFIFRKPPGSSYSANQPLHYTDTVCVQWAAVNNGESEADQPNSNSSNCGWYGCRVLQPPNAQNSGLNPKFDHGGTTPAVFMLMAPPSVVLSGSGGAKLPIYSGDPFCLQYVGTGASASGNWGFTGNCGWFGCRVLADYLGTEPTLGEFGWQHGGGTGAVTSPTGWPKGPTVFTIEIPGCYGGERLGLSHGPFPCSCINDPTLQCYNKDGKYNPDCCGIGCTGCDGASCGQKACATKLSCGTGSAPMVAWEKYSGQGETPGTKANGWSRMVSPDGKIGYVTGKPPCQPGYFWNTPQGECSYAACPSGTQYQWISTLKAEGTEGLPSYKNPDSLPSCLCKAEIGNCYININGSCKGYPNMDKWSGYWFSDALMGGIGKLLGNTATKCNARKASWQTSCGPTATVDNKFLLSGAPVNTPCDIQDVTKVENPDSNGTGNVITKMNPEGIKIYNLDVPKIFKTTSYKGFLYFYPNQLTGWNLYADPISKTSTDSNGTLYLYTHMNPNGVKINAAGAACFVKATHLYIGGPPWGSSTALQACAIPQNLGTNIVGGKTNGCKPGAALKSGASCTIACKPGYKLSGGAVDSYSCTAAKLTPGNIQCKPVTCNIPKSFGIGIEGSGTSACKYGNILSVNASCDVGCKKGYKAVSGTTAYTCAKDGSLTRASLVCNKLPVTKEEKEEEIVVKKEAAPPAPQVACVCQTPDTYSRCPVHKNYAQHTQWDRQYGLGHKSGHDRYHHERDHERDHEGGHKHDDEDTRHQSSRRVPTTYDDYYRTTTFSKSNVKAYDSLMNLFV